MRKGLLSVLVFPLLLVSANANAKKTCVDVFKTFAPQSAAVRKIVVADGYKQWLLWEQTANLSKYLKPTEPIQVPLVMVSPNDVTIAASKDAPAELLNQFRGPNGSVLWAKHPYNKDPRVPFLTAQPNYSIPVYMTSSRSLALDGALRGFTIKLATDHPHGVNGERQPGKIQTNDDVDSALLHTNHLNKVDKEFGEDPKIVMLGEVMTVAEKKTGIGMVVRDVRPTTDGNYYLPALSVPYVGREIAELNGQKFEEFFEKSYASLLGEAKARLLLRTGLQMETPNPQNMLIQLDRNLKPTGKMYFRDISDSNLVDVVAKGLGYDEQIALDIAVDYKPVNSIRPFVSNSLWRLDEAGDKSISQATKNQWAVAHNKAYVAYINKELGMNIPVPSTADTLTEVYDALKSDVGQIKLRQYRERMINQQKQRVAAQQAQAG